MNFKRPVVEIGHECGSGKRNILDPIIVGSRICEELWIVISEGIGKGVLD